MASGTQGISIDEEYNEANDNGSIFGDSSRMSLASSISNYRLENNRRYHAYRDGEYWIPNDEEALRLDKIAHHIFLLTLHDKLFLAPLRDPKRVIDVGAGVGIWASDFAEKFPRADVIGTDLSPCQQDIAPAPNLRFEVDDCCSEWIYPQNYFDYIHVRLLYASVKDWPAFYKECYRHLAPGGYLEQAEISPVLAADDGSIRPGDLFHHCSKLAVESTEKFGKSIVIAPLLKQMITDAGFVDVVETRYMWPIGDWPTEQRLKEVGKWNAQHWIEGLDAWGMRLLTQYMGWSVEQVKTFTDDMRTAINRRTHNVYQPLHVVYARKPA